MLKAALAHIETHLCEDLSADQVARQVHFSPSHFHVIFRTALGLPPAAYIRERRLQHAAVSLARGRERVVDIALRYGFENHETFTRAFQRRFGCSPTAFRASHCMFSVPRVEPGIHGPIFVSKEELNLNETFVKETQRLERGLVLHGVPRVSYYGAPPELTPYPACISTAIRYVQGEIPYCHYHCMGSTAFRLMWNTSYWDGGNVDVLAMSPDAAEPLRRAAAAGGYRIEMLVKDSTPGRFQHQTLLGDDVRIGTREQMIAMIRDSLERGIPAIGFGIIGPPEACLITGLDEDGDVLMGWNFFQAMPELAGPVGCTPEGYYSRRGWFEHEDTLGVLVLRSMEKNFSAQEQQAAVAGALRRAVQNMSPHRVGLRAAGQDAFDAWAADLGKASEFPADAPLPMLFERLMCVSDAQTMVAEGRSYAEGWLRYMAEQYPQAAEPLTQAAKLFEQSHNVVWEMWDLLGGLQMGEEQARNLGNPSIRSQLLPRIAQLKEFDARAMPLLQQAADLLG